MTNQEAIDRLTAMRHSFLSSGGMKATAALTMAIEVLQERAVEEARAKDSCRSPANLPSTSQTPGGIRCDGIA